MKVLEPIPENAEFVSDLRDDRCPACNTALSIEYSERVRCECGVLIERWEDFLAIWRDRPMTFRNRLRLFFRSDRFRAFLEGYANTFNIFPIPPRLPDTSVEDALASDWRTIQKDLFKVMDTAKKEKKSIR